MATNAPVMADIGLNIVGTEEPDQLHGEGSEDSIFGLGGSDLLHGHSGRDTLYGGHGNDSLYGGQGNDRLFGEQGDDFLDGGGGADVMRGGAGNDDYIVDNVGDVVIEVGNSWDYVRSYVSFTMGEGVDVLNLVGGDIDGTGNDSYNEIFGSNGNNYINGGGGDDYLDGRDGNDTIDGGAGRDYIISGRGNSVLNGGAHSDQYVVSGSATVFEAVGEGNNDAVTIYHDGGEATVTLLGEIEEIYYSGYGTTLVGTETDNYIVYWLYGDPVGSVYGGDGNDYIESNGALLVDGGTGDDILSSTDAQEVFGGEGDDVLLSFNYGTDLTGGAGNDWFVIEGWSDAPDTILDFSADEDMLYILAGWHLEDGSLDPNTLYIGEGDGAVAQDADDYLIFDRASGALYFDFDGNGTEWEQTQLATINVVQGELSAENFAVWFG